MPDTLNTLTPTTRSAIASTRSFILGCTAFTAVALAPAAAHAQAAEDNVGLEDIIVTAQKREQSLQDVPVSVTAVTSESLQANRITNVSDLSSFVPNVSIRNLQGNSGTPSVTMRGVFATGALPGQDRSIALYQDGVYLGAAAGLSFELPDLAQVEVLRGPQGTLFGRNSTGGAISIMTRDPSGEFGLRQELTYGNRNHLRSVTRVELPAWGPFSASVSYTHNQVDGDVKNLGAGTRWDRTAAGLGIDISPKTLGDRNVEAVFAAVKFEPSENFKTVYKFDWMQNHNTPQAVGVMAWAPDRIAGPDLGGLLSALYAANPFPIAGAKRPDAVNNAWSVPGIHTAQGHVLTSDLTVSDEVSLKNILAYRKSYVFGAVDLFGAGGLQNIIPALGPVGSPYVFMGNQNESRSKQWSDELQLNYDSDFLTLTAGAMYFKSDTNLGGPNGLPQVVAVSVVPDGVLIPGQSSTAYGTTKSKAVYAQAELHVLPNVDVLGGYRYTHDDKTTRSFILGNEVSGSYKKGQPTYMIGANFKPNDDIMLYAKYSTGFVSGGTVFGVPYAPEKAKSWEAGIKADLLDNRLRFNLSAFSAKYTDLQAGVNGANFGHPELEVLVVSAGDTKSEGFEAELTAAPIEGLTLNGGLGYTKSKLTRVSSDFTEPYGLWYRPKWTANLSAAYETQPLFGETTLAVRGDAAFRGKMKGSQYDLPADFETNENMKAVWLLNARASLKHVPIGTGNVEVSVWGRNLTNNDSPLFPLSLSFLSPANPGIGATSYETARSYGLDLIFEF